MKNNYDIMAEQARQLFLTYDQVQLCRRLSLPFTDTESMVMPFLPHSQVQRRARNKGAVPLTNRNCVGSVFCSASCPLVGKMVPNF